MIASSHHVLVQIKDNQPKLRRLIERAMARLSPQERDTTRTVGRNRWETQELHMFPAKDLFRSTPWENLVKTVLRLERTVYKRVPMSCRLKASNEIVFWVSSACGLLAPYWNAAIRKYWGIENGSHYVRDTTFAEGASRIRRNPDIAARLRSFAYNLIRAQGWENIRNARYRADLDVNLILKMPGIV